MFNMRSYTSFSAVILLFVVGFCAAKSHTKDEPCDAALVSQHLDSSMEPSDAFWDPRSMDLWVVSDEGTLVRISYDGSLIKYWSFDKEEDFEGVLLIPGREEHVYLQIEDQQLLYEFNIHSGTIDSIVNLTGPGTGLEAVTWIGNSSTTDGSWYHNPDSYNVLYSGGQLAGDVYVHKIDFQTQNAEFVESFFLPQPNPGDLSAMHYSFNDTHEFLTVLYDMHKLMVRYTRVFGEDNHSWVAIKQWTMPDVGSEGIAWGEVDGQLYFFVCVDTSSGYRPKQRAIKRYSEAVLDDCFQGTDL